MTSAQTTELRLRFASEYIVYYRARCERGHWRTAPLATPTMRERKSFYLEQSKRVNYVLVKTPITYLKFNI